MNPILRTIMQENARLQQQTPYNFCDRWCQRCKAEVKQRCALYMDELDCELTNIGQGKEPEDLDAWKEKYQRELLAMESECEPWRREYDFESDEIDTEYDERYQRLECKKKNLHFHPLQQSIKKYTKKAHFFLKKTFYKDNGNHIAAQLHNEFEIVAWYHTLISAKMYRALCGIYARDKDEELAFFGLCDGVAQLAICKRGITRSCKVLRIIAGTCDGQVQEIRELLVILANIKSRIRLILADI